MPAHPKIEEIWELHFNRKSTTFEKEWGWDPADSADPYILIHYDKVGKRRFQRFEKTLIDKAIRRSIRKQLASTTENNHTIDNEKGPSGSQMDKPKIGIRIYHGRKVKISGVFSKRRKASPKYENEIRTFRGY